MDFVQIHLTPVTTCFLAGAVGLMLAILFAIAIRNARAIAAIKEDRRKTDQTLGMILNILNEISAKLKAKP